MTAKAHVKVTLEITLNDTWGDGTPVEQVRQQAIDGAVGMLKNSMHSGFSTRFVRLIGEPKVTMVIVEDL